MAGSSKNTAMELERVYTPRSVAAIQAALSTLHDKLESGHTQANQLAVHPVIALQNKGNQQTENTSVPPFCVLTACNGPCAGGLLVDDSMCMFALQNAVQKHSVLALAFKLQLHPLLSQCLHVWHMYTRHAWCCSSDVGPHACLEFLANSVVICHRCQP